MNYIPTPEELEQEFCRRDPARFMKHFMDEFVIAHFHQKIFDIIRRAATVPNLRVLLSVPPQHGKSEIVCKKGVPWLLGKNPGWNIIFGAYADDLAGKWSRQARRIIRDPRYAEIFPNTTITKGSDNIRSWETDQGGSATFTGVRGGVTGLPANLVIIDDPYKNRKEAESEVIRKDVEESFKTAFTTRLAPGAGVIVIHTRWHEEDLIANLAKQGGYEYINFSAYDGKNWLFPERYDAEFYLDKKKNLGAYDWEALYMGNPRKPEGSIFKRKYAQVIPESQVPASLHQKSKWKLYFDLAFSSKHTADYTTAAEYAIFEDNGVKKLYCCNPRRIQLDPPDLKKWISSQIVSSRCKEVGMDAAFWQTKFCDEVRNMPGLERVTIHKIKADTDKRTNFLPVVAKFEAGEVFLIESGEGWDKWIDEWSSFTGGKGDVNDDCVDNIANGWQLVSTKNAPREMPHANPFSS